MEQRWIWNRVKLRRTMVFFSVIISSLLLFQSNPCLCRSLNNEGLVLLRFRERIVSDPFDVLSKWDYGEEDLDPCSWFGVHCSDGKVVTLNLQDLALGGMLAPEIGKLRYLKSIILRNNSFSGHIPREIEDLKELEVLDLGYNNFSGPFPSDLGNNLSLSILLLDNNEFLDCLSTEVHDLKTLSEIRVNEDQLTGSTTGSTSSSSSGSSYWSIVQSWDESQRRLLQGAHPSKGHKKMKNGGSESSPSPSPSPSLSPSPSPYSTSSISFPPSATPSASESPSPSPYVVPSPSLMPDYVTPASSPMPSELPQPAQVPSPASIPSFSQGRNPSSSNTHRILIWSGVAVGLAFLILSAFGVVFYQRNKVVTVKPWATGLSGQLQKAFITGVPSLQRSELETACEDFSNIIGSFSDGTVYKGTLSSGVEIAVTSTAVKLSEDWSESLETRFRNKIEMLSKVNHKNFVNLIGFCEEENPFTRMMVFEYAPNGTLFEHLHIKEAEHLDWAMRLRIAMGIAYCLEYLHQLTPPIAHKNLHSSSIYLTEDYATKISDFSFWNEVTAGTFGSATMESSSSTSSDPESNVYSFGVILFELFSGRMPRYSVDNGFLVDWEQPLKEMVDPTLSSYQEDLLEKLFEVVKWCVVLEPNHRPKMRDVTARLKEITALGPDGATPRVSPLWWAELEIMSTDSS